MKDVSITDKKDIVYTTNVKNMHLLELSHARYHGISIGRCNIIVADQGNMKITGQFTSMEPMLEELSYGSRAVVDTLIHSGIQTPCTCVVFGLASVNFEIL